MATPSVLNAQEAVSAPSARVGTIAGVVHEVDGTPIGDAEVLVARSARLTRTTSDGRFVLNAVPEGQQTIVVRKLGYLPARADLRVGPDSAVMLSVALVSDAQSVAEVRITGHRQNLLQGVVVDETDRPVEDADVTLVGTDHETTTDSTGRFIFRELPTGTYLLQARKVGFSLAQHGVRMVDRLERDVTMRLRPGARPLTAIEVGVARIAAREARVRHGAREQANTVILGREELARYGSATLDIALKGSAAATFLRETPFRDYCLVVDGWRAIGRNPLSPDVGAGGSILGNVRAGSLNPGGAMVQSFFADEIEMVEVYPENTEHSDSLCGRFASGSGCECPPFKENPPTLVIWLRK